MGAPVPVLDKLAATSPNGVGNFDISPAGVFVGVSGAATGILSSLLWLDAAGNTQTLEPRFYNTFAISPDGKRLATVIGLEKRKPDIVLCDLERERIDPLTFTGDANSPVWTPDGKRVVFRRTDSNRFYWIPANGSGKPELLFDGSGAPPDARPLSFSPDGWTLLFFRLHRQPLEFLAAAGRPDRSGTSEGRESRSGAWIREPWLRGCKPTYRRTDGGWRT